MTGLITDHFSWTDAACHNGTPVPDDLRPNAVRVAQLLEGIRSFFGGALVPVSWYRTPAYNAAVGGAHGSRHMRADAVDVRPAHLRDMAGLILCVDMLLKRGDLPTLGGYGKYPGWIHVDTRPRPEDGHIARWFGGAVGAEQ